jgi:predicted nucleic acid-binding protein
LGLAVLVYLDSCIVIYLIEKHPEFYQSLHDVFRSTEADFCISPLVKLECLTGAFKRNDPSLVSDFETFFDSAITLPMPESVFLNAARLRTSFNLKTPDALHLATAELHKCDELWTNDDRLTKVSTIRVVNKTSTP